MVSEREYIVADNAALELSVCRVAAAGGDEGVPFSRRSLSGEVDDVHKVLP